MNSRWLLLLLTLTWQLAAWGQTCAEKRKECDKTCVEAFSSPEKVVTCKKDCYSRAGCGPSNPPPPPLSFAWDVIESQDGLIDGLMRNPVWRWQTLGDNQLLDACDSCPCNSGADQAPTDWKASPTCTQQWLHTNTNFNCRVVSPGYHINWLPVEYEGWIKWDGHSSSFLNDDDYNFRILRSDQALVTKGRVELQLEFNAQETVDSWDNTGTWWDDFHHNFVDKGNDAATQAHVQGAFAIVIGMLGLDLSHPAHQSELHPVYAMFIRLPGSQSQAEDRWTFFIRNWGNEGYCGPHQEELGERQFQVRLIAQQTQRPLVYQQHLAGMDSIWAFTGFPTSIDVCASQSAMSITNDGLVTMNLPPSPLGCGIVGDFTMRKGPPHLGNASAMSRVSPPTAAPAPPAMSTAATPAADQAVEADPVLTAKIAKLSPADRSELETQLAEQMKRPTDKPTVKQMAVSRTLPHAKRPKATGEGLKAAAPNPVWQANEEKKQQLIELFLKEHGIN